MNNKLRIILLLIASMCSLYVVEAQVTEQNITVDGINVQTNYITFSDGISFWVPTIKVTLPTTFNFSDVVFMYLNVTRRFDATGSLGDDDITIALWNNSNYLAGAFFNIFDDMPDGFFGTANSSSTALLTTGCMLNVDDPNVACLINVTALLPLYLTNNVTLGQNMSFVIMDPDLAFNFDATSVANSDSLFLGNAPTAGDAITFESFSGVTPPNLLIGLSSITVNATVNATGMQSIITPVENQWDSASPVTLNITGDFSSNVTFNIDAGTNVSFCDGCFTAIVELTLSEGTHNISFFAVHNSTLNSTGENSFSVGLTLGLCSDPFFTTPTANFTYRVEDNSTIIAGTSEASFLSALNSSIGFSNDFSVVSDTFQICTVSTAGAMNSDSFVLYTAAGFTQRSLSARQIFTTTLRLFDLFLEVIGETVAIIITVQDVNNKLLSGRDVEAQRFFVSTNSFKLVDSCLTDENGVCELDLNDASNIEYKFLVKNGGTIELETGRQVLTSTSLTLTVLSGLEKTLQILNNLLGKITSTLTYDTGTTIVTLTYTETDDVISLACLDVFNRTAQTSTQIGNVCSSANSDTLTFTIPAVNISYLAYFNVIALEDGNNYTIGEPLDIDLNQDYLVWGNTGLFLAFIGILAFAGAVAQSPILVIIAVLIGLMAFVFTNMVFIAKTILIGLIAVGFIGIIMMARRAK